MKKVLSANYEATISVECLADDLDFQSKLTRDQLEEMAKECLANVTIPLELCLKESGTLHTSLDRIHSSLS
jgi:heat shock protein 4